MQGQVGTHPAAMTYVAELPDVSTLRAGAVSVGEDAAQPRPAWLRLDEQLGRGRGRAHPRTRRGRAGDQ